MADTSISLLQRASDGGDGDAWNRLSAVYTPLLHAWMRRYDVQPTDAEDVVQEVLFYVARELPRFRHQGRPGAFRAWLRQILHHRLQKFWAARDRRPHATGESEFAQRLAQLEDPASGLSQLWDAEHDRHVTGELLELIRSRFSETTWEAFRQTVLEGKKPAEAAEKLGLSPNAVCAARSRVLSHLRHEGRGLID
jgi:RNA polymerase sigma-70 factor (ECF subfamily)